MQQLFLVKPGRAIHPILLLPNHPLKSLRLWKTHIRLSQVLRVQLLRNVRLHSQQALGENDPSSRLGLRLRCAAACLPKRLSAWA
jgi:hypothetical protein